ncbi:MAG: Xcc1710-like domain-containing protein [Gammaproteobacteria bacterium]|nr:Xcc1710-like domain-containing protein [Gammaproteobacteria bacterium]
MALAEDIISNKFSIQAYERDQITINDRIYTESLVLSPDNLIESWSVNSVTELRTEHLECIFDLKPDVILLGTGEKQIFPDIHILGHFASRGLGVEVMNTGALCRTYNILVAEDRQVVAAFILGSN